MIHKNTSITETHLITYLQNSVSGKAKDLIHAYSCDPSYYQTALNELIRHFGDCTIIVSAFINQLKHWQISFHNKQNFTVFFSFLKRLVQAFQILGFTADFRSSTYKTSYNTNSESQRENTTSFGSEVDRKLSYRTQLRLDSCGFSTMFRAPSSNLRQSESRKHSKNHQFSSFIVCQIEQPANQAIQ